MAGYGTVAEADTYHAERGNSSWGALDPLVKEASLARASCWIDQTYRALFPGRKAGGREQEMEWPRHDVVDDEGLGVRPDEIPREILMATYEAALRQATTPGGLSPDIPTTGGVTSKYIKAGSVEIETKYQLTGALSTVYPIIGAILMPLLSGGTASGGVIAGTAVR